MQSHLRAQDFRWRRIPALTSPRGSLRLARRGTEEPRPLARYPSARRYGNCCRVLKRRYCSFQVNIAPAQDINAVHVGSPGLVAPPPRQELLLRLEISWFPPQDSVTTSENSIDVLGASFGILTEGFERIEKPESVGISDIDLATPFMETAWQSSSARFPSWNRSGPFKPRDPASDFGYRAHAWFRDKDCDRRLSKPALWRIDEIGQIDKRTESGGIDRLSTYHLIGDTDDLRR